MKILALIPARGGSKGIPDKNIQSLMGFPLIAYSIVAAKLTRGVDRTVVSTDSKKIAAVALKYGAEVPFFRPKAYASDKSTDKEWLCHALNWFRERENLVPNLILHLRPTTPFRDPKVIVQALKMMKNPAFDSLRSAHEIEESPYKMFDVGTLTAQRGQRLDILQIFRPYMDGRKYGKDFTNLPRQTFPACYAPNGYIDVLRPYWSSLDSIHGEDIAAFVTKTAIEIDTMDNLVMAEMYLNTKEGKKNPIFLHLLKHYGHLRGKLLSLSLSMDVS